MPASARPLPVLLGVLTLTAAFAGCLAATEAPEAVALDGLDPRLSKPLHAVLDGVQDRVASHDGVEIDNWVWRPDVPEGARVPVIVNFSPYWGNLAPSASEKGDAFGAYLVDFFVPRGYAVVLSSARGTGDSDGCFTIGGPGELADMEAVVDHYAAEPWSNGLVGAGGKSYDGTMPQGLLVTGNEHVKAIFPVSPISEFYKYNYANGVPYLVTGQAFNTYYVMEVGWGVDPFAASTFEQGIRPDDVLCPDNVDVQRAQYESTLTGDYTLYWQDRNYTAKADDIRPDVGVFYVHGLGDWNVKPDHMLPWLDAICAAGGGSGAAERRSEGEPRGGSPCNIFVKQWLGQWAHEYPTRSDLNATLLRFFDHFLKGVDTGLLDEPRVDVEDDAGTWRHEADWPPPRAVPTVLYPSTGESLAAKAPGDAGVAFDGRPLPAAFSRPMGAAVFVTDPLDAPLRIAGAPHLRLLLSSLALDGAVAATLYDVGNDTWSPAERVVDQGFLDLRHRVSMETPAPLVPGEAFEAVFDLYPQDDVIPAGHRLALVLTGTSPEGAPVQVVPTGHGGLVTVHLGEATSLTLPVVPDDPSLALDPQPDDVGCWLC